MYVYMRVCVCVCCVCVCACVCVCVCVCGVCVVCVCVFLPEQFRSTACLQYNMLGIGLAGVLLGYMGELMLESLNKRLESMTKLQAREDDEL